MPAKLEHNWPELYKEFEAFGGYLRDFCDHKTLSYTYASKHFAAIDQERNAQQIIRAKRKLANSAPKAAEKLEALLDSADESLRLKASTELLNKVGISSQTATVQVSTGNQLVDNRVQIQFFLPENDRKVLNPGIEARTIDVDETKLIDNE